MKILFISHSYPPILGGVESQNYNLAQGLSKIARVKIIANGYGKWWLPVFVPITFIRAFFLMMNYDACLVGNGVLSPIVATLKFFHPKKKFFSVVHGLDITFANKSGILPKIYKVINIPSLKKLDKLFMVGNFTIEAAVKSGVPKENCIFIPNGVFIENFRKEFSREDLSAIWGSDTTEKKVILRLGRFVPHKGTAWFIKNIMPRLDENIILFAVGGRVDKNTAGDPDNFSDCEQEIIDNHLADRVKLIPNIPQKDLEVLLNTADLVVSPNINYKNSSEGFGINAIEAAACERVIIASNMQGLADAIKDGKNGFLVESENTEQWVKKINAIFSAGPEFAKNFGEMAGKYVQENFTWEKISKRYLEEMEKISK
ncbi:MAG: glycosyltransferase family 4 protein [Parcubacteria group bacterium]|jgi:phosphatidylinositol alpha-1,6-mannosyltransferase